MRQSSPFNYFNDHHQEKDKKKKEKAKKNEPELKPVKEIPIAENEEGSKNETGCVIS